MENRLIICWIFFNFCCWFGHVWCKRDHEGTYSTHFTFTIFANLFGWIWLLPLFTMWSYKQQQKQALKIFMLTNVEFFSKKSVICLNWQGKIRIKKFFHCEVCNIPWLTWSNKNQKKYWDFKLVFKGSSKLYLRTMKTMVFSVGLHCTNFL